MQYKYNEKGIHCANSRSRERILTICLLADYPDPCDASVCTAVSMMTLSCDGYAVKTARCGIAKT